MVEGYRFRLHKNGSLVDEGSPLILNKRHSEGQRRLVGGDKPDMPNVALVNEDSPNALFEV